MKIRSQKNLSAARVLAACLIAASLLIVSAVSKAAVPAESAQPASRWYGHWIALQPRELGYDEARLKAAIDEIGKMRGVQALLLLRHGYLVAERYWRGGSREVPHNLKSASKSVMSALVGIAIDRGHFRLDQPVFDLLPGLKQPDDPAKKEITVRHLLAMTSGLRSRSYQAYDEWVNRRDWVKAAMAEPLQARPGTSYDYNTANSHLLSAILASRTGRSTRAFAQAELFDPMGIEIFDWQRDPDGIHLGGNNLWLKPRDLAKFGQLYLDRGRWGDRQLINPDWVKASTTPAGKTAHETYGGYGYLWWTPNGDGSFAAVGYGGQYILVSPKDDTVIVVLSTLVSKGDHWEDRLFEQLRRGVSSSLVAPAEPRLAVALADTQLRAESEDSGRLLRPVGRGERLEVFADDGDWLRVRLNGEEGWLRRADTEVRGGEGGTVVDSSTGVGTPLASDDGGADGQGVSASDWDRLHRQALSLDALAHAPPPLPRYRTAAVVNFRRSPNLAGELIGKLQPGTEFQALERSEAWLMARIDGQQGWLHSDFANVVAAPPAGERQRELVAGIADLAEAIGRLAGRAQTKPAPIQAAGPVSEPRPEPRPEQAPDAGAQEQLQRRLLDAETRAAQTREESDLERRRLEQALARSEAEVERLGGELDRLRRDIEIRQTEFVGLQNANDELNAQLMTAAASITLLDQSLQESRRRSESQAQDASELREENRALLGRLGQLSGMEGEFKRMLEAGRQELAQLQTALTQAIADQQAVQHGLQAATTRNETLEAQLLAMQKERDVLADRLTEATAQDADQQALITELRSAEGRLNAALEETRSEGRRLGAQLEKERQVNAVLNGELADLRVALPALEQQLAELVTAGRDGQRSLDEALAQIRQLEKVRDEARLQTTAAQQRHEEALAQNAALQEALEAQRESGEAQALAAKKAETEAADRMAELQDRDREIAQLRGDLAEATARIRNAQENLSTAETEVAGLQGQLESGRNRLAAVERDLADARRRQDALEQQRAQLTTVGDDLQRALVRTLLAQSMAITDRDRLEQELALQQQRLDELARATDERSDQLEARAAQVASLQQDLAAELSARQSLEQAQAQLDLSIASQQKALDDAAGREEEAKARIASLETALEERLTHTERLEGELGQQRTASEEQARLLAELRSRDTERAKALSDTHTRVRELEQALERAAAQEAELAAALESATQEAENQGRLVAEMRELDTHRSRELALARDEMQSVREQVALAIEKGDTLAKALDQVTQERERQAGLIAEQRAESASQAAALTKAKETISRLQQSLDTAAETGRVREQGLRGELAAQQDENTRLKDQLDEFRSAETTRRAELQAQIAQAAKLDEELGALRADKAQLEDDLRRLSKASTMQIARIEELESVEEQLSVARIQLSELKRVADRWQQEGSALLTEVDKLEASQRDGQQRVSELLEAQAVNAEALRLAQDRISSLALENEAARRQEEELAQALVTARERVGALQLALAEQEAQKASGQAALSAAQAEIERLTAAFAELDATSKERSATMVAELEAQRKVKQGLEQRLRASEEQWRSDEERLTTGLASANADLHDERKRSAALSVQVDRLTQTSAEQAARLADYETIEAQLGATRSQLAVLQRAADAGQKESQALLSEIERFEEAGRRRERDLAVLAERDEQRTAELAAAEAELAALQETIAQRDAEALRLQEALDQARARSQAQLAEGAAQDEARAAELAAAQAESAALREAVAQGEAEAQRLQEMLDQARARSQAQLAEEAAQDEVRAAELAAAQAELAALQETIAQRDAEAQRLQEMLDQARAHSQAQLAERATRDEELAAELAALAGERDAALAMVAALERLSADRTIVAAAPLAAHPVPPAPVSTVLKKEAGQPLPSAADAVVEISPGVVEPQDAGVEISPRDDPMGTGVVADESSSADVETVVLAWAAAWSRQDVEAYLGYYADDYRPDEEKTHAEWVDERRVRLTKPRSITVELSDLNKRSLDGERIAVTFVQAYSANHYSDRVSKTLELLPVADGWKIVREVSRPLAPPPLASRQ